MNILEREDASRQDFVLTNERGYRTDKKNNAPLAQGAMVRWLKHSLVQKEDLDSMQSLEDFSPWAQGVVEKHKT